MIHLGLRLSQSIRSVSFVW